MIKENRRSGASEIRLGAPLPPRLQTGNDELRRTPGSGALLPDRAIEAFQARSVA